MKDQLMWNKLDIKKYIGLISSIGKILSLKDEDYRKEKVKAMKMDSTSIADALISAFGDGK